MKSRVLLCITCLLAVFVFFNSANADINDGLVAYYPFNGNADDETGNGNDGTVNGALLTTDRDGNANSAYSFDGIDDNINLDDKFDTFQEMTIAAWIKMNTSTPETNGFGIVTKHKDESAQSEKSFAMTILRSGDDIVDANKILARFYGSSGDVSVYSNEALVPNNWYFVTSIFNNGDVELYVDGQLQDSATSSIILQDSPTATLIGDNNTYDHPFNGIIDEVRIYNRALSESEVLELFQGGNGLITSNRDFNGDGKSDIIWRNKVNGKVFIWLMDGNTITSGGSPGIVADFNWRIKNFGDYNGDGKSDILWRNSSTGATTVWFMNGITKTSSQRIGTVDNNWEIR